MDGLIVKMVHTSLSLDSLTQAFIIANKTPHYEKMQGHLKGFVFLHTEALRWLKSSPD
jgi:hypothetical protein